MKKLARRLILDLKGRVDTITVPQGEYESLQHRPGMLDYINPRVMIMSTLVYFVPIIDKMAKASGIERKDVTIFDAGARDGWTVHLFNELGFKASGAELVSDLAKHAKSLGRDVVKGDIHDLKDKDASYDVVFCRHTLEHTMDPRKAMSELIRICKPGGLVFVTLPIERAAHGKHTTAVPNLRLLRGLADGQPVEAVELRRSASTGLIIPDGDEGLMILRKT